MKITKMIIEELKYAPYNARRMRKAVFERLKENIISLPSQLNNILALRPVEFDYKTGGHQIGFIAQEMQEIYPDAIGDDGTEEKLLSITGWDKTSARLVKAIQELKAIIDTQQTRITALNAKVGI